jgi:hypothetical protein
MSMQTTRFLGRLRTFRFDGSMLAIALVALALPDCSLERGGVGTEFVVLEGSATIRTAEGMVLRVASDDVLLSGGSPRDIVTERAGALPPEERARPEWRKYLLQRLSDPAASPEAMAVFGGGPWCLLEDEVHLVGTRVMGSGPGPLTGDEIPVCPGGLLPPVSECLTGDGTVPALDFEPPSLTFAPTPVGTLSPEELVLTIRNAGTGRLCLALPGLDLSRSEHPEHYAVDPSDCAPLNERELAIGRAMLRAERPMCQVRVRFSPTGSAPGVSRLRLSTNDETRSVTFVDVTGEPLPGALRAVTNPVCFNTPAVVLPDGRTCRRNTVALRNDGPGVVTVRSLALPAAATGWGPDALVPLPRTVGAGGTLSVPLLACAGTAADTVLTVGSDAAVPVFDVTLLRPGSGCTP